MSDLAALIPSLLPLRALDVALRFRRETRLKPTHQPALTGFLRSLLGSPAHYDTALTLDAPENGRTFYPRGERYHFTLFALAGGEPLLALARERLAQLPGSAAALGPTFGDNVLLDACRDHFGEAPLSEGGDPTGYGIDELAAEIAFWQRAEYVHLRWVAPARLLREKAIIEGKRLKSEQRFCATADDLSFSLLAARLHDSLADLLRRRGTQPPPRTSTATEPAFAASDLFWVDARYTDPEGHEQPMGGVMGMVEFPNTLTARDWALWVIGQYLGIGQRRAFGYGRYRLETADGVTRAPRLAPARSLLWHALRPEPLREALTVMAARNPAGSAANSARADEAEAEAEADDEALWADEADAEPPTALTPEWIDTLAQRLLAGRYEPPPLRGVIRRKSNGGLRPLAVPPLPDRVLQRAVAQALTPTLEPLFSDASYGYRPRRSRLSVRQAIQSAYQAGYRWVYESDVADFFDSADWFQLRNRLQALLGDDPVIESILGWVSAPVEYQGQLIRRRRGLPQGSPLSPILANLLLDAFDHQLMAAGFKLARFADDFVILCKNREQAEAAAVAAEQALTAVGLRINPAKTRIRAFSQGFHYLGYLFVEGLVLDVGGKDTLPVAAAAPPPLSWLAELAERLPSVLNDSEPLPEAAVRPVAAPASPVAPSAGEAPPAQLGRADLARGAMVCITGPVARLSTRDGQLLVLRDDQLVQAIPWRAMGGVILFGPHHITTPALRTAMQEGVAVHFANHTGHYQGSTWPMTPTSQGWQLWLDQQALTEDPVRRLAFAKVLVEARLRHQREVLRQRGLADAGEAVEAIDQSLRHLGSARALDDARGLEGIAARHYFSALRELIPEPWGFTERNRHPPRDPFNVLLSLGYNTLYAVVDTLLRADGLMPWLGIYHRTGGSHSALASDLMEPFRHLIERTALAAVTRQRLSLQDFTVDSEQCWLVPAARNRYLGLVMERFDQPITALGAEQPRSVYDHLHAQNHALIDWLRGQAPAFVGFRMR